MAATLKLFNFCITLVGGKQHEALKETFKNTLRLVTYQTRLQQFLVNIIYELLIRLKSFGLYHQCSASWVETFDECVQIESIIVMRDERTSEGRDETMMIPSTGCTILTNSAPDHWHSQLALESTIPNIWLIIATLTLRHQVASASSWSDKNADKNSITKILFKFRVEFFWCFFFCVFCFDGACTPKI